MRMLAYSQEELRFAWCNRVLIRCRTHRCKPIAVLQSLTPEILSDLLKPYEVHLLEFATTSNEFQAMLSLTPNESISTAVSKTKGRISKWLSDHQPDSSKRTQLARGYFAVTLGEPDSKSIEDYLGQQSEHHGYDRRAIPPVYVQSFDHSDEIRRMLATDHASTLLRYHLVLATWYRRGVFTDETGRVVAERWRDLQKGYLIDKVSFVPDHVHIALTLHPVQAPVAIAATLMNSAQDLMWDRYSNVVIKSAVERLWQSSAYIGSFGALSSKAIKAYMHHWSDTGE